MNRKLLAGVAAVGLLSSGASVTALAAESAPVAAASHIAVTASTSKAHDCGPLGPLVAKGTLTHSQAVAIHNAFIRYVRGHWRNVVDTVLSQQAKNHVITRAQASAVASAITQWVHKYQAQVPRHHGTC